MMRVVVTTAALIGILVAARGVLQPLAVGVLIWLVLGAVTHKVADLVPARLRRGRRAAVVLGGAGTLVIVATIGILVARDVAALSANLPLYEANLDRWIARVGALAGEPEILSVSALLTRIDARALAFSLAGSTASYTATLFVVLSYAIFIFVEAEAVDAKIAAFAGGPVRERRLRTILDAVRRGIDDFLAVQTLIGVLQAVPTYILLVALGVDAALFLAVLIFVFSFIPTVGTLIGIAFPVLMTLVQFTSLGPAMIVLCVLGAIQIACSNVLAPQLMSRSLNLSPLVVLFAVFAGGAVWGIVGALIAVPVLTIAAIFCAEEPSLRPVAILLSANGTLPPPATAADADADDAPPPRLAGDLR